MFFVEFFCGCETELEKYLEYDSGADIGTIHEKARDRKSRAILLKILLLTLSK
jgi:hypothetical protein